MVIGILAFWGYLARSEALHVPWCIQPAGTILLDPSHYTLPPVVSPAVSVLEILRRNALGNFNAAAAFRRRWLASASLHPNPSPALTHSVHASTHGGAGGAAFGTFGSFWISIGKAGEWPECPGGRGSGGARRTAGGARRRCTCKVWLNPPCSPSPAWTPCRRVRHHPHCGHLLPGLAQGPGGHHRSLWGGSDRLHGELAWAQQNLSQGTAGLLHAPLVYTLCGGSALGHTCEGSVHLPSITPVCPSPSLDAVRVHSGKLKGAWREKAAGDGLQCCACCGCTPEPACSPLVMLT